jgi:hypothetical protein
MQCMHNDSMSSAVALLHQIDWIKNEIETQVDAGIENFTLVESAEGKLLEFCKVVVNSVVGKIDVAHALDCCAYLQDTGHLPPGKDCIACLMQYFYAWMELQLARRYA